MITIKNSINGQIKYYNNKIEEPRFDPWGDWIDDLMYRYANRAKISDLKIKEFYSDHLFFMTLTFDRKLLELRKGELGLMDHDRSTEWDDFHYVYGAISEALYGKGWARQKFEHSLPMAVACMDFEGSRYAAQLDENLKNVHFHIIWVVYPGKAGNFQRYIEGPKFKLNVLDKLHIDKCELQAYDDQKATIRQLATYASKALPKTRICPLDAELVRIYPNKNYSGEAYVVFRNYRTEKKREKRIRAAAWSEREHAYA